ncbi:hypothetical protein HO133_002597 [Letharia lupina]|uniref:Uncharacterized protein n=1 Tax=Letharia lupina TaxID=560253 RepID=A0A8H6CCH9_9LECA|nr:uncharacterized protein HO133_002597 [Letharia lupina]KAF6220917.1 hypothetical protein HO133_002597 [Letharia lupina]
MISQQPEPTAVVGSGCRFPGSSSSPSSLWALLKNPRDVSREIPDDRFELQGYYHPDGSHHGTTNVQRSYTLDEDVRVFDATFFNISPNEADSIDPQQRLLMEVVYEALEAGGHSMEGLRGSDTAVYVGTMSVDYNDILIRDIESMPTYFSTGTSRAILSNRISYFFDWHGPSMTIDTACSSSIVALHQGIRSLRTGESRVAIVGGTELLLGPEQFVGESKMNLLSPTGRSRMWDAGADGYARGDGIAALVLKNLRDAIADGDHIECLIRETGVNQDGRSAGLTVPSSEAQAKLIRGTYARAGLDISSPQDWPQFFEAHGTGTKVGDPREAAAINECFGSQSVNGNPLYVGSIKTIIGHTEGTAGLAGVLKASLAIQHGIIPPNMLLNRLNPDIEQYYGNLHVPTAATQWPTLPEGVPRRVSVNSFGFGGTNGHAILESYQPSTITPECKVTPFTPYVFSAATGESLVELLQIYRDFLKLNNVINLGDLAWTLQSRRSALPFKTAFSASDPEELVSKIEEKLEKNKESPGDSIGIRSAPAQPRLLGIFTGQGAQWVTMGAHLVRSSATVREKLERLDHSLATLPEPDRPLWRIADELSASTSVSRLGEAAISQPLCTAIQLLLVDLLRSAGITFEAVVGHSSGEIAAAYAAGFISAHDAIRIAYYRGVRAKLAKGSRGQKGAMLAVGTSWEDANDLIKLPAFKGRVKIAAHNSAASLTLSGDADSLTHAKRIFDEEKKFARMLQVDTAYHSHHMTPCSKPYIESLRNCKIQVKRDGDRSCSWYSSVKPGILMEPADELRDVYWRDNMVNTVFFTDAVKSAVSEKLNLAMELGPHPALKGPASQIISDSRSPLPYTGVLNRGCNDVEAFSDALGFVWTQLGPSAVDFRSYNKLMSPSQSPQLAVGLPSYQWSHKGAQWHESRLTKNIRLRGTAFHELLGVPTPNNTDHNLRFRNFLKVNEIPWLDGHQLQGQVVFPAAGYVAMALAAGKEVAGSRDIEILEVHDLTIDKAIAFDGGANFAVETLTTLTGITPSHLNMKTQSADFAVFSCWNSRSTTLELVSKGKITIVYGTPSVSVLSSTPVDDLDIMDIDSDRFYSSLDELGYGYSGPFRTLSSTRRRLDQASAMVSTYEYHDDEEILIVHPTMLDVAFQASLLARSSPGDDQLWSLHVPTSIKRIRVNPELCSSLSTSPTRLPVSAVLQEPASISMNSNVDVFSADGQETVIQVEGLVMKPLAPALATDDRPMFSTTQYGVTSPVGNTVVGNDYPSAEQAEIAILCERLACCYLRHWRSRITEEHRENSKSHHQSLRDSTDRLLAGIDSGHHPYVRREWAGDDLDQIKTLIRKYPENIDLKVISVIGENISALVRGQSTVLEHMLQENMLEDLFHDGLGFAQCARTGHTTKAVLEAIGTTFSSYTYTDVSADVFEQAAQRFEAHSQRMNYKIFDVDQAPSFQGFEEHSYEVVIISPTLHTSSWLQKTLGNVRRLLKPGGYLLVSEITTKRPVRIQIMMGGLSGPWTDVDNGQNYSRTEPLKTWHNVLRKTGFSGVDTTTSEVDGLAWPFSVIVSQAVDERIDFLRKPLSSSSSVRLDELVILGSCSLKTSRLAEEICELAGRFCGRVTVLEGLPTDDDEISPMATFINLVDIDEPIFKNVTEEKMEGLKCLFELSKNILWVTEGARGYQPYHNASIGFGRSIAYEIPHVSLQFLDLTDVGPDASRLIAESVLRVLAMDGWDNQNTALGGMMWSKEPELYLEDGQLLVPRIIPNDEQNARINSLRRSVTQNVSARGTTVLISEATETTPVLHEEPVPRRLGDKRNSVQVNYSILSALNVAPLTFLFFGIGTDEKTGDTVVTLSDTNSSKVISSICVSTNVPSCHESAFLAATASEFFAGSLISKMPKNCHVLVHEPGQDGFLASALTRLGTARNIRIKFSTSKSDTEDPAWIKLNPWASETIVKNSIPLNLTHFFDLAADDEGKVASLRVRECLPSGCRLIDASDLYRSQSLPPISDDCAILKALEYAVSHATSAPFNKKTSATIWAGQIADAPLRMYPTSVIDWTLDKTLTVQVHSINPNRLFSKDRTYLLVGLSGQLGRSISEWMSRNGAGYICLTSRNPGSYEKWQTSMEKAGTTVKFFAMDITKNDELRKVVDEIKNTGPPIAGVANGAALFDDSLFSEMSLEKMEKVIKPKIDGTNYLNEIFSDNKLDFFIVFSSLTSVIGNSGQSNYTAANAYMTSLMKQRRKRGLAGTSLEIGRIAGIGYMERAGDLAREQLIRFGFMTISETDFHHLIAEAIRAGSPDLGAVPIVTAGCRNTQDNEESKVAWFDDPRFSHKVLQAQMNESKSDGMKNVLPVCDQLADSTTIEKALEVLRDCFAAKVAAILQLVKEQVGHEIPLVELGIDSLAAIEVRSWFLKEIKTDIPVLKILRGGTVAELCEEAMEKLPESLLPNIGSQKSSNPKTAVPPPKPARMAAAPSESCTVPLSITSSGSQSLEDAPTAVRSTSSSTVNLKGAAEKASKWTEIDYKTQSDYVKSELVSFAQSRFWFLRLLVEDQTTFNVSFYYRITGNLRIADLERAVRLVTTRHESLRTCFVADEKEPDLAHQKILPSSLIRLERKSISSIEELHIEYTAMKAIPFDIASGKLMRLNLLTRSLSEHYLLFNYHHILMDGVSLQVFLTDLRNAYQRQSLGVPPCQLSDVSRDQRAAVESGSMDDQIAYWRNEFPEGPPVLPLLPMAKVSSRMPMKAFNVNQVECRIDAELAGRVKAMSNTHRSTTFHFYLAAFKAMLFRFTDAQELTIGIADANRNDGDVTRTVGLLLNLLTLRFKYKTSQRFSDCVAEARTKVYEALDNSRVPFDVLLKELNVPRSSSYSPFFQAFFDYRQGQQEKLPFGNTTFEFLELYPGRTAYDLTLDITDSPDSALILFRTQASLYDMAATRLLLNTYVHLLEVFTNDTSLLLREPPLFSQKQLECSLDIGRGPDLQSSWPETLPHRIDMIAQGNKDKVALNDGHGRSFTYASMTDRIEAIAEIMQKADICEGSRVLVFQDASVDWPCSMLAIMRLGGVYIPLDLRNPLPRLADIAASCQPAVILVDNSTIDNAPQVNISGAEVINVSSVSFKPSARVPNSARAGSVGAILYTSGSTGNPKGIIIRHSGLRNEIEGYTKQWGLKAERVLQQSAFTFNHYSDQIYTGLVNGGSVYIVPWSKRGDPIEVSKIIREEGITYTKATPTEYSLWLDYGRSNLQKASKWRFAFGGGEPLTSTLTKNLATLDLPLLRFFNSYGPTEISISSTKMEIPYREEPQGRIPCGYSLPNYVAYILDEQRKPVPVGMPGELWIGGAGVSLGYLDNKELTDYHFVHNPYATPEYTAQGWTTMYRTSDIAHLQDDGAMVFHSRVEGDTQVKIRGLRIELGDIESSIIKASDGVVKQAAVTLRDGDPQFLVAHVVLALEQSMTNADNFLRNLLNRLQLPQYMVPVLAISLDRMPLNNHSKVDRKALKALPLPQLTESDEESGELSETMLRLIQTWESVLSTKELGLRITPSTGFFAIGGNSLLVVRLQSRIREIFNVTVRLVDLLEAKSLGEMARQIEESTSVNPIDWEEETTLPDLSFLGSILRQPLKVTGKIVLVTGAGGFLGKTILAQLIESSDIDRIHCVGLRDKSAEPPRKLAVSSSPKIIVHKGDLSEPWLGLSESDFWAISSEVDSILHMGAIRSFWDNYHLLRPNNVTPTKQLVRMAAARRIPIHYTSTAGVVPGDSAGSVAASVAEHRPPTDGLNGYVATRWASEQVLERAASTLGVPVSIHRFVSAKEPLAGATIPALEHFVGFVDQMSTMPEFDGTKGQFEMIPVDEAAGRLAEALIDGPAGESKAARFYHHQCEVRIDISEMMAFIENRRGNKGLETMPGLKFIGRMKALGLRYFVTSQVLVMESTTNEGKTEVLESRR